MKTELTRIESKIDCLTDILLEREIGTREAARRLGISVREVQRRAKKGELKSIPNSRPYRFHVSNVIGRY